MLSSIMVDRPAKPSAARFASLMLLIGLLGLAARMYAACFLPDDSPSDARGYQLLARNLLEQHVFSSAAAAPFTPTAGRMPGYPLFLASVYALFGAHANGVVRVLQAFFDAGTCVLAAWLAWLWAPRSWERSQREQAALLALLLTAACPFVAVYLTTILTETLTTFCWMLAIVATTRALHTGRRSLWLSAGLACGGATLLRPDSGLLVIACAGMLLLGAASRARGRALWRACALPALLLSGGFVTLLVPFTLRNALTFHKFMPVPQVYSNLNDGADEVGYGAWLTTWVDDFRYVEPLEWRLDSQPILLSQLPESAFDSEAEKQRVSELLFHYNHPAGSVKSGVLMTPALDAAFGQLARERRARHPLRQHVGLPVRRAFNLWFDTHSDFFWFAGQLRSYRTSLAAATAWRAIFLVLTWCYTAGAVLGLYLARPRGELHIALWFAALIALPRLWFLGQLENPEPRYVIEFYPWVISLCALGLARISAALPDRFAALEKPSVSGSSVATHAHLR